MDSKLFTHLCRGGIAYDIDIRTVLFSCFQDVNFFKIQHLFRFMFLPAHTLSTSLFAPIAASATIRPIYVSDILNKYLLFQ
jgi:hypothetical protein